MKSISTILFLAALVSFSSCKKFIEQKQQEAAVQVITSGRWQINSFSTGPNNQVSQFSGYQFQFNNNSTVDAYHNGAIEMSWGWTYDLAARTVTGNFPTTAEPLALINGVWTVTNSTETSVDAERTVNGELRKMHMDKQ